jgi:peptide/nickel transport system substrate-binding protein
MMMKTLMGATLLAGFMLPACGHAEVVLTAMPDESTAWIENFNPFNTTTACHRLKTSCSSR